MTKKVLNAKGENTLFDKLNKFLEDRKKVLIWVILAVQALFTFLLFDGRLSFATDDSTYIQNALALLKRGSYPSFQGSLYPFFLAIVIKLAGVKILLLKTFSLLFLLGHTFFLYKALQNRVPWLVTLAGLIVSSINAYILAYGSSTFSEAFYLFLQSVSFYVFFNLLDKVSNQQHGKVHLKNTYANWLSFGLIFFLLSIAKTVALFAIGGILVFFLLRKEWRNAIIAPIAFAVFKVPYELIVRAIWGKVSGGQAELLLRKDFNDPSQGTAGFADFMDRFIVNFGNYFSVHTFKILGLRGSGVPGIFTFEKIKELRDEAMKMEPSFFYSLIFIVLFGLGLYFSFKKNKYIFYILLYVSTLTGVTFFALHTFWNQDRLVVIYVPLIFIGFCFGLYELIKTRNLRSLQTVLVIAIGLVLVMQLFTTLGAVSKNSKQFKGYTKADPYYGYPMGVANFAKMCNWAGKNVQDTALIACNKNIEAAAFGGELKFIKMPQPSSGDPDTVLNTLRRKKIGYVILDSFGADLSPVVQAIYQKYPEKIQQMRQEGEMEPAYLLKINY